MAVIYRSGPKAVKNVFSLAAMFLSSISLMHFVVPKAGRYLFEVMIAEVENLGYQRIPKDTKGWNMWWRHYQYQLQTRHIFRINYKHGKHQEWFSFLRWSWKVVRWQWQLKKKDLERDADWYDWCGFWGKEMKEALVVTQFSFQHVQHEHWYQRPIDMMYTLENQHRTQYWRFGRWFSFPNGWFLGSILIFRGVIYIYVEKLSRLSACKITETSFVTCQIHRQMKNLQESQGRGAGPKQKVLVRVVGSPSDIEGMGDWSDWWPADGFPNDQSLVQMLQMKCVFSLDSRWIFQGVSTSQSGLILGPENTESDARRCWMLFVGRVSWGDAYSSKDDVRWIERASVGMAYRWKSNQVCVFRWSG